jgi:hypothetical protein
VLWSRPLSRALSALKSTSDPSPGRALASRAHASLLTSGPKSRGFRCGIRSSGTAGWCRWPGRRTGRCVASVLEGRGGGEEREKLALSFRREEMATVRVFLKEFQRENRCMASVSERGEERRGEERRGEERATVRVRDDGETEAAHRRACIRVSEIVSWREEWKGEERAIVLVFLRSFRGEKREEERRGRRCAYDTMCV